jgi:hypothetical protein
MYKIKYLKYKNKYLNLKNQLGGECECPPDASGNLPKMTDRDFITLNELGSYEPSQRITINGKCYFVDGLYDWVIRFNNNNTPHNRNLISPADRQRIINAYNALHLDAPQVDDDWGPIPIFPVPGIITYGDEGNVLNITSGVTHINNEEYANRSLGEVIIPNSVTHIGDNAFANNLISELKIPSSVTHIGDGAFANNQFLSRITIPDRFSNTQSKERIFGHISLNRINFTYLHP